VSCEQSRSPFPAAIGVLYCDPVLSYEREVHAQAGAPKLPIDLDALLRKDRTWQVEG